jgi:biotin carboxyl carrier protein
MIRATTPDGQSLALEFNEAGTDVTVNGKRSPIDIQRTGNRYFHILRSNRSWNAEVLHIDREAKTVRLVVNGKEFSIALRQPIDDLLSSMGMAGGTLKNQKEVKAPMPGMVLKMLVSEGQAVSRDEPLVILEAMKMENVIKSPVDGTIRRIGASQGLAVEKNTVLVEFD